MADAVLLPFGISVASGLLKTLMQKSADALSQSSSAAGLKSALSGNLESQLAHLKPELEKLDALLCSDLMHPNRNAFLLPWLKRVKEAANFGDNLLEDISYERLRRQAESNAVSNFLLCGSDGSLPFRIKIGRKINKFMSKIDDIYNEGLKIGLRPVDLLANPSRYQPSAAMSADLREIRENVDTSGVVGREADEELIVGELCRSKNEEVLGVIAIVGMSGVGKTALARKIYDNDSVTEQYKKKIWIFVSDNFKLRRFLAEMLQSLTEVVNTDASVSGEPNIDAMEQRLKECLKKERYLLVLDDVWNTNQQVWNSIRTSLVRLANGCTGSMVLVTTQVKEVASVMGASLSYEVKLLSEDDSWKLFESKAFLNKSPQQVSDLRDIGERILNKCEGFPLAINTLASLLGTMNERSQWESVERSQLWNLPVGQTTIMPWLLLSFNHLPEVECPAIKQCFAHCSILIPKGTYVSDVCLITSWIAQGFIQLPETSDQDYISIGRPYIKSMCDLGLLQLYNNSGQHFIMHDLIHDLTFYVSGDECLTISDADDLHKASSSVEHVLIHGGNTFNSQLHFPKGNTQSMLRTLNCQHATVSIDLVVQARFLRQLELIDCGLKEIPRSIERLKHLRRLHIKDNPIKYLPDSIGNLFNLQVLTVSGCDRLFELPQQAVTKLVNLRCLEIHMEAVHIPKGLGQLTRLTRVPPFKLKAGDGCRIKELGTLKHLVDILKIRQLENMSCKEDAMEANLNRKPGIEVMVLEWSSEGNESDIICTNDEEVMEGLQPHSNLKQLWVRNFRGKRFSLWLSSGLYCINLTKLTLLNCKRCEQLPTLGCLPRLKILDIEGMESVEVIGSDFFACSSTGSQSNLFPSLEEFYLWNMPNLKEWCGPSGSSSSAFPCLQILHIQECPALVSVPSCFHSLQELIIKGMNSGEPLLMILSNSYKLTSLMVENIQQLTCLSEPLLKCTSLRLLKIKGCKELVELPPALESMACLETLTVENCDSLTSLPSIEGLLSLRDLVIDECEQITDPPCGLESCVSIEKLYVEHCRELNYNPDMAISSNLLRLNFYHLSKQMSAPRWLNHLSNLTDLTIGGFNNELENFRGIEHLPKSLKLLYLVGWPKLKSLPEELQSLHQLKTLRLYEFDGVTAVPEWLGNLYSLQYLKIKNCKNMKHLPSSDAMQRLTQLGELVVEGCPLLEERCGKEGGEEWHKISHIPSIQIIEEEALDEVESSELVEAKKEVESALRVTIGTSLASALLKALIQKSATLSVSSSVAGLFGNLESQLADLQQELEKLDALLCSAERMTPAHHNCSALLLKWVGGIKKAANFAANLLDDISYEQIRRQTESNTVSNLSLPSSVGRLGFRIKIGRKINKCMSMIGRKIGLKPVELVENLKENVDTSFVVGREADEELIVRELCRPKNDQLLGVIAIIGISGVGKTTLARKIYHNEIVTEQYKNKVWISMTDDFNIDAMEKKLKSCLEKERYLLVLDDVRNVNQQVWDSMKTLLVRVVDGCTGSSMVLVTTQLQDVASVMGASLTHGVNILSKYDSRALFGRIAFANKSSKEVSDLRDIGETILNRCGGVPLAINTLATLLENMNERSQWESVDRSQVWNLLNFNYLASAAIKRCFAHCSILIPKGEYVSEGYLFTSWFAQGFIKLPETSDQDLWTIGRLYIKSMCDLGLLQLYSDDGYKQCFTMHDHIHDFAVYVSGDEYLTVRESDDLHKASSGVEHVLIDGGSTFNSQLNFPQGNAESTLRTLMFHHATVSLDLVVQARFLRHIDLIDCGLKEIPRSIERLKHLGRFHIEDNPIKYLPDSIGSLYNLQDLVLLECHRLFELPQQVTKLLNLRWIETTEAVHIPKGFGQLTRLTRVPPFKLKAGDGCRINELGSLKNVAGLLTIEQLENVSSKEDVVGAGLKNKAGIEYMKLGWSREGNEGDIIGTNDEEVMEGLQPNSNLKQLWVENFRGKKFSSWLSSGLYCINLTKLTLVDCKRCEQLPTLGCLSCLKFLVIEGMESVEVIGSDFFGCFSTGSSHNDTSQCNLFPSLEELELSNMPKLKEWFDPLCASAFPCLLELNISDCPALFSIPSCFHSLQILKIKGVNSGEPLLMTLSISYKLTSLWVENVQRLRCLSEPLLECTSLRILTIIDCKKLVELPPTLQSMSCLETLVVRNCDRLTSLPDIEGLLSLRVLQISECERITDPPCGLESCVSIEELFVNDCPNLNFNLDLAILSRLQSVAFYNLSKQMSVMPWLNQLSNLTKVHIGGFDTELDNIRGIEHLPRSLKSLELIGWPKLKSLPDELQSLTQLETLHLCEFDGVTTLPEWLGSLSSLQSMKIWDCEYMKHLPSLNAIRRLTRLGELVIEGSPLLEERCRKEGGEEWHKISHISRILINEEDATYEVESSELVEAKKEVESALRVTIGTSLASGLLKALIQKSASVLSKSPSAACLKSALFGNLKSQLTDLKQEVEKLGALLCSAERMPLAHQNRSALLLKWLGGIKKAANFADNLLDNISYERIRRQTESNTVSNFSLPSSVGFHIKIGRKLNKCMSMIAKICKEATKIGLKPIELAENLRENVDISGVIGREADEELIVGELCRPNNDGLLGVIAIVGMSGVGKTTLARKIYHNETLTKQYKNKVWISMTDDFNIDAMENKLKSCLEKGRYLLVLDDAWNTDKQVWESIRTSLVRVADGCTGTSMVLVTTLLQDVASVMGASFTHGIEILSDYDSRVLFERKAFVNKSPEQVSDLRDIGETILNKCEGLPLAINTLASFLGTMNERNQWESVDRSQVWNLLDFNHLPSAAIKRCFAHCSILIPRGEYVSEGCLITSWIAQGFIQLSETSNQDMLAIGRAYIKSMTDRDLLQLYYDDDNEKHYFLNDFIHDLAIYVSGDKYLSIREPTDLHKASSGVEHVSIHGGSTFNSPLNFPDNNAQSTLRTLICERATISIDLVVQARFLRDLQLIDCGLKEIPTSIERLKHLRNLDASDNPIKYLPESIGSLYNLQVLTFCRCDRLFELPKQVTKLLNLRDIDTTEAVHIPKGFGQLTRLTLVPPFKLKAGDGCRIKELGNLKHLVGTLAIERLENISCKEDAMEADLNRKAEIEVMTLKWSSEGNEGDIIGTNVEEVMEGLQPHSNLKELWVENFRGKRFSLWLSSGLYCINLTHLTLLNCKRCEQLPTLGCLPYLEILRIDGLESVEVIGSDFFACSSTGSQCNHFPSLEELELSNMPKLKEWFDPLCVSAFPCLLELNISDCPVLFSIPSCFHSLQDLHIEGINSDEPLLMILSNSYKLTSLWVENVQRLTSLSEPLLECTSLRILRIIDCKELVELPPTLQSMGCLETLVVRNCDSLTSLPDIEGLLSLRVLQISECEQITDPPCGLESCVSIEELFVSYCPNLNFNLDLAILSRLQSVAFYNLSKQMSVLPWLNQLSNLTEVHIGGFDNELDNIRGIEHLPKSLKSLYLIGWPKIKSLPYELQSLTQLETLWLCEFDGVTALPEWLGSLSSLQSLKIWHCEYMKHLPSLNAIRRLTRLGELIIEGCPLLEERCRKEGGEEWHKISHIPRIQINDAEAPNDSSSPDDGTSFVSCERSPVWLSGYDTEELDASE